MSDEGLEAMEPRSEAGAPVWMATFADMMSLLLCFFVLLLSFASIDIVKFRDMLGSLDEAFGVERADPGPFRASTSTPVDLSIAGDVVAGTHLPRVPDEMIHNIIYENWKRFLPEYA